MDSEQQYILAEKLDYPLRLEHLEFLENIGQGAYGKVVLARYRDRKFNPDKLFAIKIINKQQVIEKKQIHHVLFEAEILKQIKHPFIVHAYGFYQSDQNLYIALNFIRGGDLFSLLQKIEIMSSKAAQFYAANIFLAIDYLHGRNIVYRDLKPQNILIDRYGFLKLTDFGLSKILNDQERTYTICGTPQYMAPQIIQQKGHSFAIDWWSFGVLLYELLVGYSPFGHDDPIKIYERILNLKKIEFPHGTHPQGFNQNEIIQIRYAKSLIRHLIQPNLSIRYGNLKKGAWDIRDHKFFKGLNWEKIKGKTATTPFIPQYTQGQSCLKNFSEYQNSQPQRNHSEEVQRRVAVKDDVFQKW